MPAPKGNKYALGSPGRPKAWDSPEEMQKTINAYYKECDERMIEVYDKKKQEVVNIYSPVPYTVEGLCETLGFTARDSLLNYEKKKGYEEFFDTIKKAKLKIQRNKIERALTGDSHPVVSIFDLKNNHGYKDTQEVKQTSEISVKLAELEADADEAVKKLKLES